MTKKGNIMILFLFNVCYFVNGRLSTLKLYRSRSKVSLTPDIQIVDPCMGDLAVSSLQPTDQQ